MRTVLAFLPYHHQVVPQTARRFYLEYGDPDGKVPLRVCHEENPCSILTDNFNYGLARALNARKGHGVTHFAMLHADVIPPVGWLAHMIRVMDFDGLEVAAAVIAIKGPDGLTSTGILKGNDHGNPVRRLTCKELAVLPEVVTPGALIDAGLKGPDDALMINTGCFVMRVDARWVEDFYFRQDSKKVFRDGRWQMWGTSEDWLASSFFHALRVRYAALKLPCRHVGGAEWVTEPAWGDERDEQYFRMTEEKP